MTCMYTLIFLATHSCSAVGMGLRASSRYERCEETGQALQRKKRRKGWLGKRNRSEPIIGRSKGTAAHRALDNRSQRHSHGSLSQPLVADHDRHVWLISTHD